MLVTPSPYRTVIEAMFRIVDRGGEAVDFRLNEAQAELDAGWSRRNLVAKIRQHSGISSYVIARYTAKCLAEQNRRCVIVSAESDATARLLARARYILQNLKGGVKPQLGTDSQRAITFPKTGSSFWIGTAGSRVFGRGDTITDLHLSEAAFYENAEKLADGLLPAAEMGEVTVESTGNGLGNWFHRHAVQAREGLGFKLFFFGWVRVPSCAVKFASEEARAAFVASLREDLEEPELAARGIAPEQLAWRRERLIEYEYDLRRFKENYPIDFDECFQATGFGFFRRLRYAETAEWRRESGALHALAGHPRSGLHYTVGGDPAGGVGADNSAAQVFCLETAEQVAEYASAAVEPPEFADVLCSLAKRFNWAYINVERNNHGGTTLARLRDIYPRWLIHRGSHGEESPQVVLAPLSHFGTAVTVANRGLILGETRRLLADIFTIHSPLLKSELGTFVEVDDKLQAGAGCKDDRVWAAAHALIVSERAGIIASGQAEWEAGYDSWEREREPEPGSFESIFGDLDREREIAGTPQRYH